MSYTLHLQFDGSGTKNFVFVVDSDNQKGWAWMRLIRIEGDSEPSTMTYEGSHLWRARSSKQRNGPKTYALVGAFGDPGSYIPLTLLLE
jgi:hypothetical protein